MKPMLFAILAAALYAASIPISKLLLGYIPPTMMAAFLYLGAGIGVLLFEGAKKLAGKREGAEPLSKKELPFTLAMIVLDIAAPILLMFGVKSSLAANASLINNFEIVATSLIALFVFREVVSKRLWTAIALVTVSSIILTFEGEGAFNFNMGSLFVFGACLCWGAENNCTRMISNKSASQIVIIKGIFSGLGSLIVAFMLGEGFPAATWILAALVLGFFSFGLSILFYILAQKDLGAAKTSAFYSIAPFLGVAFGLILLGERPALPFYIALAVMLVATFLLVKDPISLQHTHPHEHTHTHTHLHDGVPHTHEHTHIHEHTHTHGQDSEFHGHDHEEISEHIHSH